MKNITLDNFLQMNPQIPQYSEKNQNYLIAGANPISYLDDGTQEEQIAPLSASIDWTQINTSPIDSYSEGHFSGVTFNLYSGASIFVGQSFTNVLSTIISGAKFWLKNVGSPTGNITAQVFAHTGVYGTSSKPTGSALATSDVVDITTLTTSWSLVDFTFSGGNKITLSPNTYYVVVVNFSGGDGSNYLAVGSDSVTKSASGNTSYSSNGSSWTTNADDTIFYIYGGANNQTFIDGNIVHMIPSTGGTYDTYAVTDTTHVYGVTSTTITDLGYPDAGVPHSNTGCQLAIAGGGTTNTGYLFMTYTTSGSVFYSPLPVTKTTWSFYNTNPLQTTTGAHIIEPFKEFLFIKDGNTAYLQGGWIRKFNPSAFTMSTLPALDLGAGFGIMQMRNYNDRYLAIAGGKTTSGGQTTGYPQNYLFIWDGTSTLYNYSMRIPGQFIDMKVIDSILYVAVKVSSGKTCLYKLYNTSLRKVFTTQYSTIHSGAGLPSAVRCSLFDFRNYIGIHLDNKSSDSITDPIMVYGSDEMGNIEFIHSYNRTFDQFSVGYNGNLYANTYVNGGNSNLFYLPLTGSLYQQILYKSQWIPVKNLKFIDIYHDTPPNSGTDAINVTLEGQGEDIIAGSGTTTLDSINSTNYLTKKRTRLDVKGFTGDQLRVTLSTVNTGSWRPIIRAINLVIK